MNLRAPLALFDSPVLLRILVAPVMITSVFAANPAMAQDVVAGESKYATCAACHGAQGQGGMGAKLVGQPADDIEKKLIAYVNKEQVGPQSQMMWSISATLTPADISNLAAYISTLK